MRTAVGIEYDKKYGVVIDIFTRDCPLGGDEWRNGSCYYYCPPSDGVDDVCEHFCGVETIDYQTTVICDKEE